MRLRDAQGREVVLGAELGRGGEGSVYEIVGSQDRVAKVYHERVSRGKEAKLIAMAGLTSDALVRIGAWPTATLHAANEASVVGIVMPRIVDHRDVHYLYSPAQRKATFPKADWSFLVRTARNVAHAFETIHASGHVIGDVNQGNVLVSPRATVKLIDCDSFQIRATSGVYLCEVGVGHFTPPELQGRSFDGLQRSPNHDRFGLAVICFHLLFMGRHPFAGRYHGKGEMPIEKAIAEYRFAFSQNAATRQMTPPPNALRLAHVSFQLAGLFERAFSPDGTRADGRPRAQEWMVALEAFEADLKRCSAYPGHTYHRALRECPWCDIERSGGPDFFISLTVKARLQTAFDLNVVWATIVAVPAPPPMNQLASPLLNRSNTATGTPLPTAFRTRRRTATVVGILALLIGLLTLLGMLPSMVGWLAVVLGVTWLALRNNSAAREERKRRVDALEQARKTLGASRERWERELQGCIHQFREKRQDLERKRNEYLGLSDSYRRERQSLSAKREQLQRKRFLETFIIVDAQIPRVGPGLKEALRSWNIETAADVTATAVDQVPGFGPTRVQEMLRWRAEVERQFKFDPSRDIDPADVSALDHSFALKRQGIERVLTSGAAELRRLLGAAKARHESLMPEVLRLASVVEAREADVSVSS